MRNNWALYLAVIGVIFYQSCDSTTTDEKEGPPPVLVAVETPTFNADSAYDYIQAQVDFGPRVPNSAAHDSCANFIYNKLAEYTNHLSRQEFEARNSNTGEVYKFQNIIAQFNPQATRRILLAAHWDTRLKADKFSENPDLPFDGANDGGSGVGVLLEVARLLAQSPIPLGVDIIFFDAEDQGNLGLDWCLGSKHWTTNKHQANYSAYYGILLDMVGAKNATFCHEYYSNQYAPKILEKVWNQAHQLGYSRFFLYQKAGAVEDDHYYVNVNAKIPMIDIIDTKPDNGSQEDFFKHFHHRPSDNMEVIDKETLRAVGSTVVALLYQESAQLAQ